MTPNTEGVTAVILAYRKNRLNHRLLFGAPVETIRRGWHRQLALFQPGQVFGYERWRANQYGTQSWRITVAKAARPGALTLSPGILPGAELWLTVRGKTKVKHALACFDRLNLCHPTFEIIPEHVWRELGLRLLAGERADRILDDLEAQASC